MANLSAVEARIDRGRCDPNNNTANSPHKIECDNGHTYCVKPSGTDRQFANELVSFALGSLLGIPMFDAVLVSITPPFLGVSPAIAARYKVGVHFGSMVPIQQHFSFRNPSPALVHSSIANQSDLYKLVLFDEVTANVDRAQNPGNLMAIQTQAAPNARFEFRAIDHGHAFTGPNWNRAVLAAYPNSPLVPIMAFVQTILTSGAALAKAAGDFASESARFREAIDAARSGLDDDDRAAVLDLVSRRTNALPGWIAGPAYAARLTALQP